jgi:putative ABC transport system permease protein
MWKATIKGLFAYKLRMALTALAVVLGVAFVSGTYVLTDTLTGFFDEVFQEANAHTDFVVSAATGSSGAMGFSTERVPADMIPKISAVPGVATVSGAVSGVAQILDRQDKRIGGMGPPTLGFSVSDNPDLSPLRIKDGRAPKGPNEVAIDAITARNNDFKVGDKVKIIPNGPVQEFTISAIVGFGSRDNLGGATLAAWDFPTAQRVLRREGQVDGIAGTVTKGTEAEDVVDRIAAILPPDLEVRTGKQAAADSANEIKKNIGQLSTAILAFAGLALFVGAFIIANTFSIIVAQRAREFALLRSLGASRTQVMTSVLAEAVIVGVVASVIGILVGLGVGAGLRALINAAGGGGALPGSAVGLRTRTVVVGLTVGTLTTLVSALVPALRGSRQPPVAALHLGALPPPARFSLRRVLAGSVTAGLGAIVLAYGLYGHDVRLRFAILGIGAVALFLGITLLSPLAARPIARVLGAPIARAYGVTGRLARENAARNPQRTAATAAALMVGLALVTVVAMLGASIRASLDRVFAQSIRADVIVQTEDEAGNGVDPAVEARLRDNRDVVAAVPLRYNEFRLNGKKRTLTGTRGADIDKVMDLDVKEGSFAALASGGGIALEDEIAAKLGKHVGDTLAIEVPHGQLTPRVVAIFGNNQLIANYVIDVRDYEAAYTEQHDEVVLVKTANGTMPATVAADLDRAVRTDYPQLKVQDQKQFLKEQSDQVRPLIVAVSALLMLSIIIALLGITNTLALSVLERTRELGLLRAVGMGRRQMRRMVRWEAVIISVLGAVLGITVGLVFGVAIVRALHSSGIALLRVPVGTLITLLVVAGLAGMGAAVFPARRAARLDILSAIAME